MVCPHCKREISELPATSLGTVLVLCTTCRAGCRWENREGEEGRCCHCGAAKAGSGDFSIGSRLWAGTSKVIEEMGELAQVLGKLIATHGETKHWSGDLRQMLIDEAGDVLAAVWFLVEHNLTRDEQYLVMKRRELKLERFREWQKNPTKP